MGARMNPSKTRILVLSFAFGAAACGSSSPAAPYQPQPGADGGGTNAPTDGGGGGADAQVPIPGDAGPIGDASISNGGDAAGFGDGGSFDFGCGGHGDCLLSQVCCTNVGPPVSFSCVDPATCPANDKLECDGPDECGPTAPVCCGLAVGDGTGTFPACGATSLGATCAAAADCQTFIGSCSQTSKLVICHGAADCSADPANNKCCSFSGDGGAFVSFCYNPTIAAAAGGHCI
jgi:hypothetical protein